MDYEKAYNEALERAKNYHDNNFSFGTTQLTEAIFPELKESEDERIRKAIGAAICGTTAETVLEANGAKLVDALAYLERQKEQNVPGYKTDDYFCEKCQENAFNAGKEAGLKEQKPAEYPEKENEYWFGFNEGKGTVLDNPEQFGLYKTAEWSKEDEKMRDRILEILNKYGNIPVSGGKVQLRFNKEYMWLRHLCERFRPQPHWKPSEKQINMLKAIVEREKEKPLYGIDGYSPAAVLESLYDDLQKLL